MGTQWYTGVHERTVVGDLLDCTEDVWSRTTGSWFNLGTPLSHIGIGDIMTHYAVVDGSEVEHSVIVHATG